MNIESFETIFILCPCIAFNLRGGVFLVSELPKILSCQFFLKQNQMKFPLIGWRAVTYSGPYTRRNCQGLGVIPKINFASQTLRNAL